MSAFRPASGPLPAAVLTPPLGAETEAVIGSCAAGTLVLASRLATPLAAAFWLVGI